MAQLIEYHIKLRGNAGLIINEVITGVGGMITAKQIALNRNPGFTVWSAKEVFVRK